MFAVFRPVFASLATGITGAVVIAGSLWAAASARGGLGSVVGARVVLVVFAGVVGVVAWRVGGVRAVPSVAGLVVRNVAGVRTVAWAQVVSVRFGPSDAWVRLDVSDGGCVAVLAIQRSDGRRAAWEAARLAALVDAWGGVPGG